MTDMTKGEDMEHVHAAFAVVKGFETQAPQVVNHALPTVITEYERMRSKLNKMSNGETVMVMSDHDRALDVLDLPDAALVVWTRCILAFMEQATNKVNREQVERGGIEKISAMHGIISLAAMMTRMNAGRASVTAGGVTDKDNELGDWKLTIEKVENDIPGYVIIASASVKDETCFGVLTKENYDRWNIGEVYPDVADTFGLMFDGAPDIVDTFVTWEAAVRHIDESDGKLVDVIGAIAY